MSPVTQYTYGAPETTGISSSPSWRLQAETQRWAGLAPPEASLLGVWAAVVPLCPHTGVPLGVSASPVLGDQGPPGDPILPSSPPQRLFSKFGNGLGVRTPKSEIWGVGYTVQPTRPTDD